MKLKVSPHALSVCRVEAFAEADLQRTFYFMARTQHEFSIVCRTEEVPEHTTHREDGWRGFFIDGELDFSLVGILSRIAGVLAENGISIFAVSTYNTDHVLVREENLTRALKALTDAGYEVEETME